MLTSTVCVALSAAGLAVALLTVYRRRFAAAARITAVALLPVGLYLTGLLTLAGRVGQAAGDWAADLVFKPSLWVGFALLAGSVLLYTVARLVGRRRRGAGRRAAEGDPTLTDVTLTDVPTAPPLPRRETRDTPKQQPTAAKAGTAPKGDDSLSDFSEVEEILKRRGI
jgi:hypothetical protein